MSFSGEVKSALAKQIPEKPCCQQAELLALFRSDGVVHRNPGDEEVLLHFETENAAVAAKIFKLLKTLYGFRVGVSVRRKKKLKKNNVYTLSLENRAAAETLLTALEMEYSDRLEDQYLEDLFLDNDCYRAYLRGSFLGGGSVNNPEGDYHLEMTSRNASNAYFLYTAMEGFDLHPRISKRKSKYLVYLKDSEEIVTFLNVIGAHKALLDFENVRILKDFRNQVNRAVNCETANLNKMVDTGVRQVDAIRRIDRARGLETLPVSLREVARLRLAYPSVSLKELGELADPPLSKSAVNHRLRKLEQLADEL